MSTSSSEQFAGEPARAPDAVAADATAAGPAMTAKALWALAITSLAVFMVTLDNLVVTTAIPVLREDLHASLSGLQWTVNAYTLTFAVLRPMTLVRRLTSPSDRSSRFVLRHRRRWRVG